MNASSIRWLLYMGETCRTDRVTRSYSVHVNQSLWNNFEGTIMAKGLEEEAMAEAVMTPEPRDSVWNELCDLGLEK